MLAISAIDLGLNFVRAPPMRFWALLLRAFRFTAETVLSNADCAALNLAVSTADTTTGIGNSLD